MENNQPLAGQTTDAIGGAPVQQTVYVNVEKKGNAMGTAGFVLALLSFVFCWAPVLNFIIWFLGALFSFIGVFKQPKGLAITGLILSFIGIIVLVAVIGAVASFM